MRGVAGPKGRGVVYSIIEALKKGEEYLRRHRIHRPKFEAEVLLSHILGRDRLHLYLAPHDPLKDEEISRYREALMRRRRGEPVAYIVGYKEFMSLKFLVGPGCFIPRPETETLVEEVLKRKKEGFFVDVGIGSGAISISLIKYSGLKGIGIDISSESLRWSRKNIGLHQLESKLFLLRGDCLQPFKNKGIFDLIVSNPPYISSDDIKYLMKDVRDFEPEVSLSGGKDGLDLIRRIVRESLSCMKKGAIVALEFGEGQKEKIIEIFEETKRFYDLQILRDLSGNDRVAIGFIE